MSGALAALALSMFSNNSDHGFQRRPRIADQMTPDLYSCVELSNEAERAGDAATALEWHQAVPMFRRGRHRALLDRLAALGNDLPPWVWARWAVYQTTRCEDQGTLTGRLHREVLTYVVGAFHGDLLDDCHERRGDPVQVIARVAGESWAFQQVVAHESGGLITFLDEMATGRLADHADLIRSWADVPLAGYRVGASLPGSVLQVTDPAGPRELEILDLGARSCAGEEGWVLGRLVPSGVGDRLVFDMAPLPVSEELARAVATAEHLGRWAPVTAALEGGTLDPACFLREDYELSTDVTELELVRFGTAPAEYERVLLQLRRGRDEVGRAAFRILRRVLDGAVDTTEAALVGAAVQNRHAREEATRQLLRAGQHDVWREWAMRVAEPARSVLLAFAEATRDAA